MSSPQIPGEAPFGSSLLAKSKANPGSIDMSIFQAKSKPVSQGTVSSDYLHKTREDNPEPEDKQTTGAAPVLSNCRFVTSVEDLRAQEEFDMAVDVKIPAGSTSTAQATFTLFCFVPKSGTEAGSGKEERSKTWTVEGKVEGNGTDPVVIKARRTLMPELGTTPGEKTVFELEATHPDLKEPCKSPRIEVVLKTVAHWAGGGDLHFDTGKDFPLLGANGALLQVLATAVGRIQKPAQEGETVICFGFTSSSGDPDPNRALSLRRAQVVKALLDRDESAWSSLAKTNFDTKDIQQFLCDLHTACGWACDPGAIDGKDGPRTKAAITSFQAECNSRYQLSLKEDGICGPKTWGGVMRAILGQVQEVLGEESSKAPSWPKPNWGNGGEGVFGNGEDFATGGDKPEERSVQITFLVPGAEQRLKKPTGGQKLTAKENPHQDEKLVEKRKIPTLEALLAAPKNGPVIHVGIFFDGTDNNRDRDRPKGHDSNVSKLFDLYEQDGKTRFKFYFEGVATGGWKESDFTTGGIFGRGIADRVRRAWAQLDGAAKQHPNSEIRLSLFGFSRGAATVLAFINHVLAPSKILPGHTKPPFDKIWFVGIFDAVGSIGVPGDSDEGDHNLHVLASRVRSLTHLVARDERRLLFPLTSVRIAPGAPLPSGWTERTFPGVHSDVGGGYENQVHREPIQSTATGRDHTAVATEIHTDQRDHLSRVACWTMYDAAHKAEVPMYQVRDLKPHSPEQIGARMFSGEDISQETPENGWAVFLQVEGSEPRVREALDRLTIPPSLLAIWKARNESDALKRLIDPRHPEYRTHIEPYIHDSMSWQDPRGIGRGAGIASGPRNIFYRGSKA